MSEKSCKDCISCAVCEVYSWKQCNNLADDCLYYYNLDKIIADKKQELIDAVCELNIIATNKGVGVFRKDVEKLINEVM